jgi:hypothetical protein
MFTTRVRKPSAASNNLFKSGKRRTELEEKK